MRTYKLSNILELSHFMKIVIDESVTQDENGNYLINVGYLRVSTDRQADLGYGLELQEQKVTDYCRLSGFTNLVLFIDDGYTGTNMDRPALQGIISYIQDFNNGRSKIRIKSMVIPRIDRLGRTLLGTLQFIQDYIVASKDSKNSEVNTNKEDINFISVQENYCRIDENNPQGKFLLMLFAGMAELDRDLIVGKLKDGRKARVASGKWIGGGNVPYGYRYDRELSKLVVVPEKAQKVREVYRLYLEEKMPPAQIATLLGFNSDSSVTSILKRKSLTGCLLYDGEEYPGEHEAIIPLGLWEEAQEELAKRGKHRSDSHYLLTGLIYCGECGARMRYQKWCNDGLKILCYSRQKSRPQFVKADNCPNIKFNAKDVDEAVVNELFRMKYLGDEDIQKSPKFDYTEMIKRELATANKLLAAYYKRLAKIEIGESMEMPDVVEELIQEQSQKVRALQKQLSNEEEQNKINRKVDKAKKIFRNLESTWPYMTDREKQTVCRELIDRIDIYKDGTIDVQLHLRSFLRKK